MSKTARDMLKDELRTAVGVSPDRFVGFHSELGDRRLLEAGSLSIVATVWDVACLQGSSASKTNWFLAPPGVPDWTAAEGNPGVHVLVGMKDDPQSHHKGPYLFAGFEEPIGNPEAEIHMLRRQNGELMLERERLKTHLIYAARELSEKLENKDTQLERARREIHRLRKQVDRQLARTRELLHQNMSLQQGLLRRAEGRLCMHETNEGIVTRVLDDELVVQYDTAEGPLEQLYSSEQFVAGKAPKEGERIEVHVFAWARPHTPQGIDHLLTPEEQRDVYDAAERATSGPLDF